MVNTARRQKTRYHHRLTDIDTVCQDKVRYDVVRQTISTQHPRTRTSNLFKPETAPGPKPKNEPKRLSYTPGSYTSETLTVWTTYVRPYAIRPRKSFRRHTRPTLQKAT